MLIKLFAVLLAIALVIGIPLMVSNANEVERDAKPLTIVATIFPQYDWARQILGDRADEVELTLLVNNGADLHNYQPSVNDMIEIMGCDMLICVGGESEQWVRDALLEGANPNMIVINLLNALGESAKPEEIVKGMQSENGTVPDVEAETDEHVWLSPKNAEIFCSVIADALSNLDPDHAEEYGENLASYTKNLAELDGRYKTMVNAAPKKTLLFGDRFPFRYLVDAYGLNYYAAFPGCSAETEASFETIVFLSGMTDQLGLNSVMITEGADSSIAQTIIGNTTRGDQQILQLNSMQSVTASDIENGTTYLSIMESNLGVLEDALR